MVTELIQQILVLNPKNIIFGRRFYLRAEKFLLYIYINYIAVYSIYIKILTYEDKMEKTNKKK